MPTLRAVKASLTANDNGFRATFKDANQTLQEFQRKAQEASASGKELGGVFDGLGSHGKEANLVVKELGKAFGIPEAGHLLKTLTKFGPELAIIGAAVAVAKSAWDSYAEAMENVKKSQEDLKKSAAKLNELLTPDVGKFEKGFEESFKDFEKELDDLTKKHEEYQNSTLSIFGGAKEEEAYRKQAQAIRDQKDAANDYIVVLRQASEAGRDYVNKAYDIQVATHGHKEDQLQADLKNAGDYADRLLATLRKLPEGTKPYLTILDEYHKANLEELHIQDQIAENNDRIAKEKQRQLDEEKKKQDEINKAIEKQAHEAAEATKKRGESLTESLENPLEHLKEQLKEFVDLLDNQAINKETFDRAVKKAKDDFTKQQEKIDRSGIGFTQIDPNQIDIRGLQKSSQQVEVRSSQLDVANKYLEQLVDQGSQNVGAYFQ